jgi:hypothetical protein
MTEKNSFVAAAAALAKVEELVLQGNEIRQHLENSGTVWAEASASIQAWVERAEAQLETIRSGFEVLDVAFAHAVADLRRLTESVSVDLRKHLLDAAERGVETRDLLLGRIETDVAAAASQVMKEITEIRSAQEEADTKLKNMSLFLWIIAGVAIVGIALQLILLMAGP